ncbi:methylthioribulose-1-phosphate dehydratase [Nitzschia inconspicua]|uniref:Methylthioribulose-1-phosphate dehydratase n=1 Tax=Nitzschia inconspicua TaxID=303405 RepID=A0A9K3K6D9_9STRA|nr:methylthioribulose-1-phosphate dehydratase [Nitzschia inconspicua]KAG7349899.1 methylthioribulose-1-phosphate dehydratase [Nitzschia inconspicua]
MDETDDPMDRNKPGSGWSNGDIAPQLFPETRQGKLQLYSSQRRWLHLAHGWSRVGGEGSTEFSRRTSFSNQGAKITEDADQEARSVRALISQLCETFYRFGWATGTGGGVSIRVGGPEEGRPWRVFVAPSGIQKEDMIGDDIFELDMDRNVVVPPKTSGLRQSACTPLWYVVYRNRPTAKSVIHTHSMYAQLATLLDPTETSRVLRITHLEMLKGVGHHAYDDILEVPIIDNRPSEDLLADQLEVAIQEYPKCNCVLVRRHGLYVWGDSWEQAKTQAESFDYLFQSAIEMKKLGLDPGFVPLHGTYRVDDDTDEPNAKRVKVDGWNASGKVDNARDLGANSIPILPRDAKHLLLDIEGCTTAISFVKDTLFPYVLEHLDEYLNRLQPTEYNSLAHQLSEDLTAEQKSSNELDTKDCASMIRFMVKNDLKLASLKALQGKMWKSGYERGDLKGHVYSDVVLMLQWMQSHGVKVSIYSSGSVQAQKLLFGYSTHGDLCEFLYQHFDITTSGNKKEPSSYAAICETLEISPSDLVFCSDAEAELAAAKEAGVERSIMSIRPGNAPLTAQGSKAYPQVFSLLQLCGM